MALNLVKKNSGYRQTFNLEKLKKSIDAALQHADINDRSLTEHLTHEVSEYLNQNHRDIIDTNAIRQAVINIMKREHRATAAESYEMTSLKITAKMGRVIKRSGTQENFHSYKLFKSIKKSFRDTGIANGKLAEHVTQETIKQLENKFGTAPVPVEDIKQAVAQILIKDGYKKVEKLYIANKYL